MGAIKKFFFRGFHFLNTVKNEGFLMKCIFFRLIVEIRM